jgi:hypothetical protein
MGGGKVLLNDATNIRNAEATTMRTIFNRQKESANSPADIAEVNALPIPRADKEQLLKDYAKIRVDIQKELDDAVSGIFNDTISRMMLKMKRERAAVSPHL